MLLFLALLISLTQVWADCSPEVQRKAVGNVRSRVDLLRTNAASGSVEAQVQALRTSLQKCDATFESLGIAESEIQDILRTGYAAEAEVWRVKAEHYATYRAVGPELERYRQALEKIGVTGSKFTKFAERTSARAQASVGRVKASCTPAKDLRAKMGPNRDQGSMGWCYGFTAADLISARLGKRYSALGAAITFNEENPVWEGRTPTLPDGSPRPKGDVTGMTTTPMYDRFGGSTIETLRAMGEKGACLEEDLNSEDNGYGWLYENLKAVEELENSNRTPPQCRAGFEAVQNLFPGMQAKTFAKILEHGKAEQLVSSLAQAACKPRDQLDLEFAEVTRFQVSTQKLFDELDAQLNGDNPVGISYEPAFMKNTSSFSDTATHASSVVGRRYSEQSGECEYLVRNSWGRNCAGYVYPCEEGNIWVPQGALARSLTGVQYVK